MVHDRKRRQNFLTKDQVKVIACSGYLILITKYCSISWFVLDFRSCEQVIPPKYVSSQIKKKGCALGQIIGIAFLIF